MPEVHKEAIYSQKFFENILGSMLDILIEYHQLRKDNVR
jgi:hypothetical protein